jgi:type IV secretory pathway VirB10-like protein
MTGDVDTFFWDKVGDVALYALIDGLQGALTQAPAALLRGNGNSFLNLGSIGGGGSGQSLAQMELQNKINRPPVMHINQGVQIEVSVGSDLGFYGACMTRMRINPMACPEQ